MDLNASKILILQFGSIFWFHNFFRIIVETLINLKDDIGIECDG